MKKLNFAKETLRVLQDADLRSVVGGLGVVGGVTAITITKTITTVIPPCPSSSMGIAAFAHSEHAQW